jgi:hypothetical protein
MRTPPKTLDDHLKAANWRPSGTSFFYRSEGSVGKFVLVRQVRLHLNRHMSATLTRRDDVVLRDVSSKRCCEEAARAQSRRY